MSADAFDPSQPREIAPVDNPDAPLCDVNLCNRPGEVHTWSLMVLCDQHRCPRCKWPVWTAAHALSCSNDDGDPT